MNNVISFKQSIAYISILTLMLIYEKEKAFLWVIILLLLGNIRRISYKNNVTYFLRMTLYFGIYLAPFILGNKICFAMGRNQEMVTAALIGSLAVAVNYMMMHKRMVFYFSKYSIAMLGRKSKYRIALSIYNLIGAAICEELFFRMYLIDVDSNHYVQIVVSAIYFFLAHYLLPWSEYFKRRDFLTQIVIGCINAYIYVISGSILICICVHLMVNMPHILMEIRRYERFYINPSKYDCILESTERIDIDL